MTRQKPATASPGKTTAKSAKSTASKPKNSTNNQLTRTGHDRDFLYKASGKAAFTGTATNLLWDKQAGGLRMQPSRAKAGSVLRARYTSPVIKCRFASDEFLPSWNILLPLPDQGFRVFMRVFASPDARPSAWFYLGEAGKPEPDPAARLAVPGWGRTRIDYLELTRNATAFQYRIDFTARKAQPLADNQGPLLQRFFVHYSGQAPRPTVTSNNGKLKVREVVIPVPYRSQLTVDAVKLRNIICCPTSLSMVLEHHGVNKPTLTICDEAFDRRHKIYGVWPQVSHVASQYGFPAWITRFRTHQEVAEHLSQGQPIIASIRVPEGELRGAKYGKSNGHIIVIVGMRKDGTYVVNDPASDGPQGAEIDYFAEDMEKVWLDKGGVGILITPEIKK